MSNPAFFARYEEAAGPAALAETEGAKLIPPDPKILEIIRLWLERLPMMTDDERKVCVEIARWLTNPIFVVNL